MSEFLSLGDVRMGDLVAVCDKKGDVKSYARVCYGLIEDVLYSRAFLKPIDITEEFLLKNGFVKEPFVDRCIYASEDNRITLDAYRPNYPRKWYVHVDNEDFASIGSCDLDYVHQLQQFLNICGIEKEFKL